MKKYSTMFLKIIIICIGVFVVGLCLVGMFILFTKPINSNYAYILYPIFIGILISTIPLCFAFYKGYSLLNPIDHNIAFSDKSVNALKHVKNSGIVICVIYILLMPFVYLLAQKDDAPGLIIFAMIPIFASLIISVFVAVLEKLLEDAIQIKTENELTV